MFVNDGCGNSHFVQRFAHFQTNETAADNNHALGFSFTQPGFNVNGIFQIVQYINTWQFPAGNVRNKGVRAGTDDQIIIRQHKVVPCFDNICITINIDDFRVKLHLHAPFTEFFRGARH
ncbi:MAG: hypothetical protein BWX55_00248 [Deltaproteobacteria bacterium ADurb.Bin022]|nr:MAG: hypothetical protein BWX55_00248 [Deltaproteobacteria bacterium ADurb.Bin022]